MFKLPWSLCVLALLAGCASKPCHERGWIGGSTKPVARSTWLCACPSYGPARVTGMPAGVPEEDGLLVTAVPRCSPAANAGIQQGDLILAVDGKPACDPIEMREQIEARTPGSTATLDVWRAGQRMRIPVVVGRERYRRSGTFGLYLLAWPGGEVDLWPIDDGVNVLGVVTAKQYRARYDLESTERAYLRAAVPGASPPALQQERVQIAVMPLAVGTHVEVVAQEAVAAR